MQQNSGNPEDQTFNSYQGQILNTDNSKTHLLTKQHTQKAKESQSIPMTGKMAECDLNVYEGVNSDIINHSFIVNKKSQQSQRVNANFLKQNTDNTTQLSPKKNSKKKQKEQVQQVTH